MTTAIAFQRKGKIIVAQIYSRYMEPLGNKRYLEVLFCKDKSGSRYRVLKNEIIAQSKIDKPRDKKKARCKGCLRN